MPRDQTTSVRGGAPTQSPTVRARARVVGAIIAIVGLVVLHWTADSFLTEGIILTSFRMSVLAVIMSAFVILTGLIVYDMGRPAWALPVTQLGSIVVVLAALPLLVAVLFAVRRDSELGATVFFCGLAAALAIFLLVLPGQAKAEVDRARRRR